MVYTFLNLHWLIRSFGFKKLKIKISNNLVEELRLLHAALSWYYYSSSFKSKGSHSEHERQSSEEENFNLLHPPDSYEIIQWIKDYDIYYNLWKKSWVKVKLKNTTSLPPRGENINLIRWIRNHLVGELYATNQYSDYDTWAMTWWYSLIPGWAVL